LTAQRESGASAAVRALGAGALYRLTAAEEIKKLKARYFRDLDDKNWKGLNSIFAEDAVGAHCRCRRRRELPRRPDKISARAAGEIPAVQRGAVK
jgi:hypothetical protein